jgi:hypothetical protein
VQLESGPDLCLKGTRGIHHLEIYLVAVASKRLTHTVTNEMLRPASHPNTSMPRVVRYLNVLDSHGKTPEVL